MAGRTTGWLAALVLALVVAGCSGNGDDSGDGGSGPGGGDAVVAEGPAPVGVAEEGRVRVRVDAVEQRDDVVVVELTALNADRDDMILSEESHAAVLLDDVGGTYPGPTDPVRVPSANSVAAALMFRGPVAEEATELTLRLHEDGYSRIDEMEIRGLPVPGAGERIEWSVPPEETVALGDVVAHHGNGTNVTVRSVTVRDGLVEVAILAVNGSDREVELAYRGRTYLAGDDGGRYALVPAPANGELRVPGMQSLQGTLRFAGRPNPGTRSLTLVINEGGSDGTSTRTPGLRIELPVPAPSQEGNE